MASRSAGKSTRAHLQPLPTSRPLGRTQGLGSYRRTVATTDRVRGRTPAASPWEVQWAVVAGCGPMSCSRRRRGRQRWRATTSRSRDTRAGVGERRSLSGSRTTCRCCRRPCTAGSVRVRAGRTTRRPRAGSRRHPRAVDGARPGWLGEIAALDVWPGRQDCRRRRQRRPSIGKDPVSVASSVDLVATRCVSPATSFWPSRRLRRRAPASWAVRPPRRRAARVHR